ncbi:DUF6796 family protein [Actinomyces capricornis]|uniref:DUF2029 domain-containing protein n=1 Tax=Actinomyces capricornis TaxID=2755559 RepID=A0ABN6K1H1_9ACTO|nr:DUF6796 family protein [Actinomyces capricornis]BDA63460.1 hypothetical protein MANAM107_02940 [Actinomyces capricornis]
MTSLTWSALAFLLSALAWILGDALIVGFHKPDRRRYGEFIELMGDDAYAFYARVNEPRLRWGALVANYSAPLMLAGLYAHWALLHHSTIGVVAVVLLGIGFSLAPLAHASFYPLALASERAYAAYLTGEPDREVLRHARRLRRFLIAAWVPAIAITAMGWLLVGLAILLGHTPLPQWAVLLTPLLQAGPWILLTRLPYPGKPLLDGALFNILNLVWAIALLLLGARAPLG